MSQYFVEELNPSTEIDWEKFNKKTDGGTFFHTLKWKNIIENSFNERLHYFLVYLENKVVAICPFCENIIRGFRGLAPIPNSDYRHLLIGKQNINHVIIKEILKKTKKILKNNKLSFILITTISKEIKNYFNKYTSYAYPIFGINGQFKLNLNENNPEKIWHNIFSERGKGKPRQYIRKFEKEEIKIKEAKSISDLKVFYKFYKANLEFKNIKPYPFSYFKEVWNTYTSTDIRITLLHKYEQIFGGLMAFLYPPKKTMYLRHLAINRAIPGSYHPTYYLIWNAVKKASEMNYNNICFGETPYEPDKATFRIKMKFGCSYEPEYSSIFSLRPLFKTSYNIYKYINFLKLYRNKRRERILNNF